MSGTQRRKLELLYLDGGRTVIEVWDVVDAEAAGISEEWLESWEDQGYMMFGLDSELDSLFAVNLKSLATLTMGPLIPNDPEPQDAVPANGGRIPGQADRIPDR